jgi:protein-S-isoprenylcysteine O-methyltransferase Ste14|tara:strand:+ start:1721 stop:2473 length:753 start_codon:yes stop_codon:yes gene_type:complete
VVIKNFAVFVYALLCYAIGLGGLVAFILYQGDLLLPRTINTPADAAFVMALAINAGLILLWSIQHSLMARPAFKQGLARMLPESAERSTYVLASGVCLLLIVHFWQGSTATVWHVADLETPLRIVSLLGWGITVWATFEIDHFDLFGVKQPFCNLFGREYRERDFVTPFLYSRIRHPIQTGVLIGMWPQALMTEGQLILTLLMTVYIFLGLYFEEKDLVRRFGERYLSYMQQVPRLFPSPGKRAERDTQS